MGRRKAGVAAATTFAALAVVAGGAVWLSSGYETPLTRHLPTELLPRTLPTTGTAGLDPARIRIIESLRAVFAENRPGTYSAGAVPLRKPRCGTWRIPGGYTLTEHLQSLGRFRAAEYVPTSADVVLYAPGHPRGQHTTFVVAVAGGTVTSVGGIRPGGFSCTFQHADRAESVGCGLPIG